MKKVLILGLLFSLMPLSSFAAIQVLIVRLEVGGTASYTVPAGKVLVVRNYYQTFATAINVSTSAGTTQYADDWWIRDSSGSTGTASYPILFPENTTLTLLGSSGVVASLHCMLVDPVDLFVDNTHEIKDAMIASSGTATDLNIKKNTTVPLQWTFETSEDLNGSWEKTSPNAVARSSDKMELTAQLPISADVAFFRSTARTPSILGLSLTIPGERLGRQFTY